MKHEEKRIIVAMDFPDAISAIALAQKLDPKSCRLKVGKELFTAVGPSIVECLMKLGFDIFLDLKFYDIPNTVANAVKSACGLGVWMVNVHASGGRKMLEATVVAVLSVPKPPLIIGVTVLTSLDKEALKEIGINESPQDHVLRLAKLGMECGLDGVVSSAQEARMLRDSFGAEFVIVTPAIRFLDGSADDQSRIVTPQMAIENGASYLVVGRPIAKAKVPNAALLEFNQAVWLAEGR